MHRELTPVSGPRRAELAVALRAVDTGRMTRRQFVARAAALGVSVSAIAALLAACGGNDNKPLGTDTALPAQINLWNWKGYIAPRVLTDFQAQTGVVARVKYLDSLEAAVQKLRSEPSGYDILFADDTYAGVLREAGLLLPLDMSLIPSIAGVTAEFLRRPPFDPETDGDKYTVPYMFGSVGYATRLDKVSQPDQSWSELFDKENAGKIGMIQLLRELFAAALFSLGYSPNTIVQSQLDEATGLLIGQKKLYAKKIDMTSPGDVIVGGNPYTECWDGDAIFAMNEIGLNKVRYVLPSEGYLVWSDALCIPVKAANPYAAHLFLDFLLKPENAAACANFLGYQPAVAAADQLITSIVQRALRPTDEVIALGTYIEDVGAFTSQYAAAFEKVTKA